MNSVSSSTRFLGFVNQIDVIEKIGEKIVVQRVVFERTESVIEGIEVLGFPDWGTYVN